METNYLAQAIEAHIAQHQSNLATYRAKLVKIDRDGNPDGRGFWEDAIIRETIRLEAVTSILTYAAEAQAAQR